LAKKNHIPNKFPGKEDMIAAADQEKQFELAKKKQRQEERKKAKLLGKDPNDNKENDQFSLEKLLANANQKAELFDKTLSHLTDTNPFDMLSDKRGIDKETSLKTFYKEFRKVVDAADVIIRI
jgi:nuclear GTP-binding protein